jgi:IS605 OrfB family transposase
MKAKLINLNDKQKSIIDNMMLIFCTAIRYSFNRLLEGNIKKGELEKIVAKKYNLNIRQSKDAVENARQIIVSQKKRNTLLSKLAKRQRKLVYLQNHIDNKTIPPVIFGTKKMFLRRCKGLISNQEWKDYRNNRFYSRGDKTKKGNPNLRVVINNGMIGIDTNPDGFALTMIDNKGNYKWHTYLKQSELLYARSNRRENLCGELAKQVILIAKTYGCGIAVEDLKFKNDKDVSSKFARVKHGFIYSKLLTMLESACYRERIEIIKVKPQFTSKIGLYKYCHQYGMGVHIFNHAIFKSLLFLCAGIILNKYKTRKISEIRGVLKSLPLTSIFLIIGMLSITGAPFFNGFISKSILKYSLQSNNLKLFMLYIVNIGTIISFIKLSQIFGGSSDVRKGDLSWCNFSLLLLASMCIILGNLYIPIAHKLWNIDLSYIKIFNISSLLQYLSSLAIGYIIYKKVIAKDLVFIKKIRHTAISFDTANIMLVMFIFIMIICSVLI